MWKGSLTVKKPMENYPLTPFLLQFFLVSFSALLWFYCLYSSLLSSGSSPAKTESCLLSDKPTASYWPSSIWQIDITSNKLVKLTRHLSATVADISLRSWWKQKKNIVSRNTTLSGCLCCWAVYTSAVSTLQGDNILFTAHWNAQSRKNE